MAVIIINQGWTDNLGDVAIGKTLKKELEEFHPIELQFAPIVAKPVQTAASKILELIKLDCRYRRWIKKRLNEISEPISAAIIGGGELLATNMNFNSAMKIWIEQLHKRKIPVFLWGIGGGIQTRFIACGVCESACPVHAISMELDGEGFRYPVIDNRTCIHCNLCEKVCLNRFM